MDALREFPILTKRLQQEHEGELFARDVDRRRMHIKYTGGSTGEPTRFWQDWCRDMVRELGAYRDEMYTGWRPGEGTGLIWYRETGWPWESSFLYRLMNAVAKAYVALNPFQMTPERMWEFLNLLERYRPVILRCETSAVYEFARFLEEERLTDRARALRLRGVVCSCENVYTFQRECIERLFGCKVFSLYGSREMHVVAMECAAHNGLHISADNVVVEILDDEGNPVPPGETGRIVVTDLWNLGFALIRYDLGDLGYFLREDKEPCPCGVTFPRLGGIVGRTLDFFTLKDGSRIYGLHFIHLLYGFPGVRKYQIVQETLDEFTLLIVGDRKLVEKGLPDLLKKFPAGVKVNVRFCDEIPLTVGGKRHYVISRVGLQEVASGGTA